MHEAPYSNLQFFSAPKRKRKRRRRTTTTTETDNSQLIFYHSYFQIGAEFLS
jgi:hypothetical protein